MELDINRILREAPEGATHYDIDTEQYLSITGCASIYTRCLRTQGYINIDVLLEPTLLPLGIKC